MLLVELQEKTFTTFHIEKISWKVIMRTSTLEQMIINDKSVEKSKEIF